MEFCEWSGHERADLHSDTREDPSPCWPTGWTLQGTTHLHQRLQKLTPRTQVHLAVLAFAAAQRASQRGVYVATSTRRSSEPATVDPAVFDSLADEWERQTRNTSSPNAIARHPVVDRIVAMGHGVVPLILERMRHRPWFWFEPLTRLTGVAENPVTADMRGDMQRMTDAWVQWGVESGRI
jgi:hypothetical protein